jgi:hypothetical protein
MEKDPKERIREMKKVLSAYLKTYRVSYLQTIREYLDEIFQSNGLKDLGCNEKCKECFLGFKEFNGNNPCQFWTLYLALQGIDLKESKNPRIVALSKQLLKSLS